MIIKTFDIDIDYDALSCTAPTEKPRLISYMQNTEYVKTTVWKKRPAVIVCPGGGYNSRSRREAEPIVMNYCAAGFHCFLLEYSVAPTGYPGPLCELSWAVGKVRSMADEYQIDSEKIFVCGFSAGGHLAASLGVYHTDPIIRKYSGTVKDENRPNGLILCYPVITGEDGKTHDGTKMRFTEGLKPEKLKYFSLENHVNKDTPKCFIWHTFSDDSVPVHSSMRFAQALLLNNIEYELHIYPKGRHGLSLGTKQTTVKAKNYVPYVSDWMEMSIKWINQN